MLRHASFWGALAQVLAMVLPFLLGMLVVSARVSGHQTGADETGKQNPFSELRNKTILVISPEPGIEISGCGGVLALLSGHANRLTVVYLTTGEKSTLDPEVSTEMLGAIRQKEAAAAFKALGFGDAELVWLHYEQEALDSAPPAKVRERLIEIIRKRRPEVVFSLDPLAAYTHYQQPDHRATALFGADAIRAATWPLEYPQAGPAFKVPEIYYLYPAGADLKVDISPMYERKLASMSRHRSQFPPALNHIAHGTTGAPPTRLDVASRIRGWAGSATVETFRRHSGPPLL
jgi:LmbE family N-acetylglucosaminyl deacetylase